MREWFSACPGRSPSVYAPSLTVPHPGDERHPRDGEAAGGRRSTQRSFRLARSPKRPQETLGWLRLRRGHLRNSRTPHVTKERPLLRERPQIPALHSSTHPAFSSSPLLLHI